MIFEFCNTDNTITLPRDLVLSKLPGASPIELKVLLYAAVAASGGTFSENDIQALSGLDLTEIIIALQFWRGAEVITISDGTSAKKTATANVSTVPTTPAKALQKDGSYTYTGEEIAKLFEENDELKLLIDECQKLAGKMFNPHETNKIVYIYDTLGLSCEYVLSVYNYCKNNGHTAVHYVEKTIFNLYNENVDTDEKLRCYLKHKEELDSLAGKIRRLMGMGNRALTKKEEGIIDKWQTIYSTPFELIEYAYELMINSGAKPNLAYMEKIIANWFKTGVTTVEQASEANVRYKENKQNEKNDTTTSFDNDEFFEAALKRSYDNIGKEPTDNG